MNFAARQLVPGDWVVQRMPGSEQLNEDYSRTEERGQRIGRPQEECVLLMTHGCSARIVSPDLSRVGRGGLTFSDCLPLAVVKGALNGRADPVVHGKSASAGTWSTSSPYLARAAARLMSSISLGHSASSAS
jgi:hypothetical protein